MILILQSSISRSRLNKAIISCAFQHKKSVLFSTEKAHTGVELLSLWKIAIIRPDVSSRSAGRKKVKRRRTSSSLAAKWCRISGNVSKIGFTAMIMCLHVFQVSCMFGKAELRQAETARIFPSSHVWKIGAFIDHLQLHFSVFLRLESCPEEAGVKKTRFSRFAHKPFAVWKMATYHALTFSSGWSLFFLGSGTMVL